jgi:hypothetical protein
MIDSPTSSWTLEDELCKIARVPNIGQALYALGFLSSPKAPFHIDRVDNEWVRGGAETYFYRFSVAEGDGIPKEALIKACVAFAPGNTLEKILQSWIERRELIAANGVIVPKLYGWGHGVVIEEFLPYDVHEILSRSVKPSRRILNQLVIYAASLSKLGFAPVGPFNDLRSHGDDVVAVDFGQDLGPPGVICAPRPRLFEMLCDYFKSVGVDLLTETLDELRATFAAHGGEFVH